MINFTVGPVASPKEITEISGRQTPYFRTDEFSALMFENEKRILKCMNAPEGSRCAFLTASGTGAMEAAVAGLLTVKDKAAVINGGTFGQRFAQLCDIHSIPYIEIKCEFGKQLRQEQLEELNGKGITALLVNMDETSSGILYDMEMISEYCRRHSIFLIVDAISSFLADDLDMSKLNADAVIIASQKALALQPGISVVIMDGAALDRVEENDPANMYLDLKAALKDMERGQTPFTPAVSILLQMDKRLEMICENGGVAEEIRKTKQNADMLRDRIEEYSFRFLVADRKDMSNAVTALTDPKGKTQELIRRMKEEYGIWLCPNGGIYKDTVFRIGHIGAIGEKEYDKLFAALDKMREG